MAQRHHWQVWAELPENASQELKDTILQIGALFNQPVRLEGRDVIMCEGSQAKCKKFYNDNRKRSKVELHFGYDCGPIDEDKES